MTEIDIDDVEDDALLLNSNETKKNTTVTKNSYYKCGIITIISILCITLFLGGVKFLLTYDFSENKDESVKTEKSDLPEGFVFVDEKADKGPITIDRKKDDGTKHNLYNFLHEESLDFYYKQDEFDKLEDKVEFDEPKYFCEYGTGSAPESYEGYDINCPAHYTIKIDKVFYGRHAGDKEHCNHYYEGNEVEESLLTVDKECGNEPIELVKELCEGRVTCKVRPGGSHFTDGCQFKFKYLEVKYHCVKDKELKKERFSIVMFLNNIKPNTVYENAVSSFYQYSKIHGYNFTLDSYRYDTERQIYFMKLHSVLEKIIEGLKEKSFDWIFWVDGDVILANPNIRLESFLPNEKMNNVHFICADDVNGLNAGVFLIRVHPWSLNFIMRAISYSYYDKKGLKFADQSSLNNVLTKSKHDKEHYIVVPQSWFNSYIGLNKNGDFLLHLAGHVNKNEEATTFREHISSDESWYGKTNKEMREEVLKYYALPKKEQHSIKEE